MIDCMVLGDSIAVGTQMFRPECVAYAKVGKNSWQWKKEYIQNDLTAKTVVISLGSNDHKGVKTKEELEIIRDKVKGSKVFWILPAIKPNIQHIVKQVAREHGDTVLPIHHLQPDGVHPTTAGYKQLARETK